MTKGKKSKPHSTAKKARTTKTNKTNIMKGVGSYSRVGSRRLRGHGGYAEDIGGYIGNWLGKKAGGLFKSITGLGEYQIDKNSLVKPNDPPIVSNTNSATRVQHREYLKDIFGSTTFTNESFAINPGVVGTFPWLATVANAFEQYRLHGLLFEFKSTSATALNSTNTALGTVIMATEYNPLHPNFVSKREMENHVYSTSCAPSVCALHPIECARDVSVLGEFYTRSTPVPNSDIRFNDMGKFQIATVGMQAASNIGELWVTYDIELIKPKLPDSFSGIAVAHYQYSDYSPVVPSPLGVAPSNTNIFGSASAQKLGLGGIGLTPVSLDTNTITFKSTGRFLVLMNINGDSFSPSISWTDGTGITPVSLLRQAGPKNAFYAPFSGASTALSLQRTVDVTSLVGSTLLLTISSLPTVRPEVDLWIVPLPEGFGASTEQLDSLNRVTFNYDTLQTELNTVKRMLRDLAVDNRKELESIDSDFEPEPMPRSTDNLSKSTLDLAMLIKDLHTGKTKTD